MKLKNGIKVVAGEVVGTMYGGPYRLFEPGTRRLVGVKMAEEIKAPCDIDIPTVDFSVPDPQIMRQGLKDAISALFDGNDLYVGCMGGVGRTGLFMALMVKTIAQYDDDIVDPISVVRALYNPHAVETQKQRQFISEFDVGPVVRHLAVLSEPKVEYVRCSLWQCLKRFFGLEV